jgi:hypothetical protein
MRVLMKTRPVQTSIRDPKNNSPHFGNLHLEVLQLDPADVRPGLPTRTLEQVRAEFQGRGPIISHPPPHWNHTPAQIPESVLAGLAPTDLLEFRWVFTPGAKR